ncbi:MAG TPA: TolC family protein [Verrucomicrobiae bacterium]|nr:TolC family protein [Verrucomicrobiae bacterium]
MALGCARWVGADGAIATNAPPPFPHYTLPQCVDRALEQNPDVLTARKRLEEAAGAIVEARAGFLPSLTSYASYEKLATDYATLGGTANYRTYLWSVNIRLTETIYSGGAVGARMDIARLQKQSRTRDFEAVVDQVIADVRIAFYDILRNKADVTVHEQAVSFLAEQSKNERAKLDVGTGQKLNVLRAEVNLALEQSALVDSRNRLRNSYLRLSELLSISYSIDQDQVPFDVEGALVYEKSAWEINDCLSRALIQRPELTARENDIKVQKKQLTVDRSDVLPHVNLYTGYDVVSEPDVTLPRDYYDGYVAGVQVNWDIFDGLASRGRMRETRARIEAADIQFDATRRNIQTDVVRAFRDLQRAEENIQTQTANVQLATESLGLATANFGVGLISQLELLQARLDLTRAQTAELSARFDYNAALARLERAMGSRFQVTETRASTGGAR